MIKLYKILIALMLFTASSLHLRAQSKIDTSLLFSGSKFTFDASLRYMSNLTYAGRKDESSVPVLMPAFTTVYKNFFLNAGGYFDVNGSKSGAEGLSITPGYLFSLDTAKKFTGTVSLSKFFITNSSPIILSSFNFLVDGQLSYNSVVKATVGATFIIDKDNKRDLVNNIQLEKEIMLLKSGLLGLNGLKITPTVTAYSGTQSFTETYYENSQVPRAIADPAVLSPISTIFPGLSQQQIIDKTVTQQKEREIKQYKLLAISGSLPVSYSLNGWEFGFTPYLMKPFHQVNYTGGSTSGNYFFYTAEVSYTF